MNSINIKIRLKSLLSIPFFLVLPMIIFSFCIESFLSIFDDCDIIVVNRFLFVGLLSPLFLCPLLALAYHLFMHLERAGIILQKKVGKVIIYSFLLSLIITFIYSYGYGIYLEKIGFIQCDGISSGWIPGMATKYAKNEALCYQQ